MTTPDVSEQLTAYIDGELSEAEAEAVQRALAQDANLRALEQRLRKTVGLMGTLPQLEPTSAMRRSVLARIDAPTAWERLSGWLRPSVLVPAGALAAAAVAVLVLNREPRSSELAASTWLDGDALAVAENIDELEDMDLAGLGTTEDLDVVANLHELEGTP